MFNINNLLIKSNHFTSLTLNFTSSGTWYLYLKDKAGNTNTISKALTYDVTPTNISVSVPNGTTAATSRTAAITLSDTSGFNSTSSRVIYKWSTETISSCPTSTSGWTSLTISTSGTSGSNTATISNSVGSGNGKIYVCPYPSSSYYPTDKWGNQATPNNTSPVSANLYLLTPSTYDVTGSCSGTQCSSVESKTGVNTGSSVTINAKSNTVDGVKRDVYFNSCTVKNTSTNTSISYTNSCSDVKVTYNETEGIWSYYNNCDITFTMPSAPVSVSCSFYYESI